MMNISALFAANEIESVTLTVGDHEVAFTGPTAGEGQITRRVYLTVNPKTIADGSIPLNPISGWAHENNDEDKTIHIDKCDELTENDDLTIGYHGTPIGDEAYNFVTVYTETTDERIKGFILKCSGGDGGGSSSNEFTLEIKQEDTIAIKPNPAYVAVSTDEEDHWIKLTAYRYEWGETENTETEVAVDWSPELNLERLFPDLHRRFKCVFRRDHLEVFRQPVGGGFLG